MSIGQLRAWQWMVLAVVAGLVVGTIRYLWHGDPINDAVAESMNDQAQFERSMLMGEPGRNVKNITVHVAQETDDAGRLRPVHIVIASYRTGSQRQPNGSTLTVWRRKAFVAQIPYRPATDLSRLRGLGLPDLATEYGRLANPTVLDYLGMLSRVNDLEYSYAWWSRPLYGALLYAGLVAVVVGVVCPSLLRLAGYRPAPSAASFRLDHTKVAPPPAPPTPLQGQEASVSEVLLAMSEKIEDSAGSTASVPTAPPPTPPPVRPLGSEPLAPAAPGREAGHKDFGADEDDYYPTERHAAHPASKARSRSTESQQEGSQ